MNSNQLMNGFRVGSVPGQNAGGIEQDGLNNLREFVQLGGTLIAFNQSASSLIPLLSLPVRNVLQGLGNDKFYCAGSLLRVEMQHPDVPINFGVPMSPVPRFTGFKTLPNLPITSPATSQIFPYVLPQTNAAGSSFGISWGVDNKIKTPYSEVFNLSIQRELPGGFTLEAAWVGRFGRRPCSSPILLRR